MFKINNLRGKLKDLGKTTEKSQVMKNAIYLIFLVSLTAFAQTQHGGGNSFRTIEGPLYSGVECKQYNKTSESLLRRVNSYRKSSHFLPVVTQSEFESIDEFLTHMSHLPFKIGFNELEKMTKEKIRKSCGEDKVDKVLAQNPWLEDVEVYKDFKVLSNLAQTSSANCSMIDFKVFNYYVNFLKAWVKIELDTERKKLTPKERRKIKEAQDNIDRYKHQQHILNPQEFGG